MVGFVDAVFSKAGLNYWALPTYGGFMDATLLRRHDFAHSHYGGPGMVSGTVKIGAVVVKRRVRLYESSTGICIREMWSGEDGSYLFEGLRTDYLYTITATDLSGEYNDVIAARVTAI